MGSQRILIVRPGALGDTILTIPLLDTIQGVFPDAHLTFLGNRRYRDVLPHSLDVHTFDAPAWGWLFEGEGGSHTVSRPAFDLAYVILTHPDDVVRNLLRAGTTHVRHTAARPRAGIHMVAHLHESLGLAVPKRRPFLANLAPCKKNDIIWVHPGSGGPSKCVPLGQMISLVSRIRERTGYTVGVTLGEEDAFLTEGQEWQTFANAGGTIVFKDMPLKDLCREIGGARLFLGNDSGISHLAAGLGVPAAVFFVRTDPEVWGPWTAMDMLRLIDLRDREPRGMDLGEQTSMILAFLGHTRGTESPRDLP